MKVRIKLLPLEQVEDQHSDKLLAMNRNALDIVARVRVEFAGVRCPLHPGADQVVVVEVLPHGNIRLDKSGLCCQDFADRVARTTSLQ